MRSNIVPGGVFPDYELPDHTGKVRTLSELQGNTPQSAYTRRLYYAKGQLLRSVGPKQTSRIQDSLEDLIRLPDNATIHGRAVYFASQVRERRSSSD